MTWSIRPWWVRWLLSTAWCGCLAAVWLLFYPRQSEHWAWAVVAAVVGAPVVAAMYTAVQHAGTTHLRAAVAALASPSDRYRAARAVRYGPVPDDPEILAAAVRFGGAWEGSRERQLGSLSGRHPWWAVGLIVALAALQALGHDGRQTAFYAVLAGWAVAATVTNQRTVAGVRAHLGALRAAAARYPGLDVDAPTPPHRQWLVIAMVVILTVCVIAVQVSWR